MTAPSLVLSSACPVALASVVFVERRATSGLTIVVLSPSSPRLTTATAAATSLPLWRWTST